MDGVGKTPAVWLRLVTRDFGAGSLDTHDLIDWR